MILPVVAGKGAPGATTLASSLAAVAADRGEAVLLVELDIAGGSIALEAQLSLDPGLQSLAAASRHGLDPKLVDAHSQALRNGARVLVSPTSPTLAGTVIGALTARLATHFAQTAATTIIDVGRWDGDERIAPVLAAATAVIVVVEPTIAGVEHSRTRLDALRALNDHIHVSCVGDVPYRPHEVAGVLGVPCEPPIARDTRAAAVVRSGVALNRWLRRTPLARSTAALLDRVNEAAVSVAP